MSGSHSGLQGAVRTLRRVAERGDGAFSSDGELLERYIRQRDETAFASLVERHGGMVLNVCRRLLAHEADAEDAFQATFLVLVRKAASIVPRSQVGNWLHGVACNAARKARAMSSKRRVKEQHAARTPCGEGGEPNPVNADVHRAVHEELGRLPANYRAVIVTCDLEGRKLRDAAQHLAWPQGTVAGRLARGRALLARRLAQRGITVAGSVLAGLLTETAIAAPLPASLARLTFEAAATYATALTVQSPHVSAIVQGVLEAMFLAKYKSAAVVLLLAVLAFAGWKSLAVPAATPQAKGDQPPAQAKGAATAPWRVRLTLDGHADAVYEVVYARDGTFLATASKDGTATLWDAATGKKRHALKGHDGPVEAIAIAPDGKHVATAGTDGTVRVWDPATGKEVHRLQHRDRAQAVAFTPDSKILLAAGGVYDPSTQEGRGELRRWDVTTGRELIPFTNVFPHGIYRLLVGRDGKVLITASANTVTIWDWDGKDGLRERHSARAEESAFAYGLALSPDSQTLAVTWDAKVHLYDVATGKLRSTLENSYVGVWDSLTFTPDGKTLLANITRQTKEEDGWIAQRGSMVRAWNVATGKVRETQVLKETIRSMAFAPDGKTLAIGCRGGVRFPDGKFIDLGRAEEETDGAVKLIAVP
jgi:RNA polymerase sigma factor (sigma-70 family)